MPACCNVSRSDWRTDLELATRHAGCNLTGDVGGFPIAKGLAQGDGSRRARHDSIMQTLIDRLAPIDNATNDKMLQLRLKDALSLMRLE